MQSSHDMCVPPNLVLLGLVFDMERGVLPKDVLMWLGIAAHRDSVHPFGGAPECWNTNDRTGFSTQK